MANIDDPRLPPLLVAAGQGERYRGEFSAAIRHYEEAASLLRGRNELQALAHNVRHIADMRREQNEPNWPCRSTRKRCIYGDDPSTSKLDLNGRRARAGPAASAG